MAYRNPAAMRLLLKDGFYESNKIWNLTGIIATT